MFSAGKLREWRGRFFRPVGWPCRPRCTLAELYLQLQRGESVSLHFFRKAKPLPMDNLRKSGVEREFESPRTSCKISRPRGLDVRTSCRCPCFTSRRGLRGAGGARTNGAALLAECAIGFHHRTAPRALG